MASMGEVIYEDYLYKLTTRNRSIFWSKHNPWRQKYFVLKRLGNRPVLEYYNKKPKSKNVASKGKVELWPNYRVEKVTNLKNRAYVFQLSTADMSICLSADEQRAMDVFVFFLQIQSRLKDQIRDDFIYIQPENSEAMRRIGAKDSRALLHVSPYGVTLALQSSRAVLAQWPLKSIRFYESSGQGQLTLEAGRIAPMGDGLYIFNTRPGDDNIIYDHLDNYVMDNISRAQPDRHGNRHEVEDYVIEAEKLMALTVVCACTPDNPDIPNTVQNNWQTDVSTPVSNRWDPEEMPVNRPKQIVHTRLKTAESLNSVSSQSSATGPPLPGRGVHPQYDNNTPRTLPIGRDSPAVGRDSPALGSRTNLATRPPMPPPSSSIPIKGQAAPAPRPQDGYLRMDSGFSRSSEDSNPAFSPTAADWAPPPSFKEVMRQGSRSPISETPRYIADPYLSPVGDGMAMSTPKHMTSHHMTTVSDRNQEYITPSSNAGKRNKHIAREVTAESKSGATPSRMRRLRSASCEDLSDYLRSVVYDPVSKSTGDLLASDTGTEDDDLLPEPFPRLQTFSGSIEWQGDHCQDNYYNITGLKGKIYDGPGLTVQEIRKRFTLKRHTMRRSVSNPNFIGSLSKERLHRARVSAGYEASFRHSHKSITNLLPDNLKKRLSKDSSHHSHHSEAYSGGNSPYSSRTNSAQSSPYNSLNRRAHSKEDIVAHTSVKGINITKRSRSFRKQKTAEGGEHSGETDTSQKTDVEAPSLNSTADAKPTSGAHVPSASSHFTKKAPKLAPKPPRPAVKEKPVALPMMTGTGSRAGSVEIHNPSASVNTEV